MRVCTVCGTTTSRGSRCAKHPRPVGRSRAAHADPAFAKLSKRLIAAHVGQYGYVCPGDGPDHAPHPSTALTLDHILPLALGGALLDRSNLRVLCKSRNSELGARLVNAQRAAAAETSRG